MVDKLEPAPGLSDSSALNDWFLSLPPGRQAVLLQDRWMLAEAAFRAGQEIAASKAAGEIAQFVEYSYVARRGDDGSAWANMFFEAGGCSFAHERGIGRAYQAATPEALEAIMVERLCDWPGSSQSSGVYEFVKVASDREVEVVRTGVVPDVIKHNERPDLETRLETLKVAVGELVARIPKLENGRQHGQAEIQRAWEWLCCAARVAGVSLPDSEGFHLDDTPADIMGALTVLSRVLSQDGVAGGMKVAREVCYLARIVRKRARFSDVNLQGKGRYSRVVFPVAAA